LELPLNTGGSHKLSMHTCRVDQTPSPEELPLDPVGVKTDVTDVILSQSEQQRPNMMYQEISQTDTDSKTDQMSKSATSKVSNSFITSITSITSLDTGYQGDGEMSRPASRGADNSPPTANNGVNWNRPAQVAPPPVPRRQDPMTDSDFFTESDADDVFNRADQRRAQVIDGHLYGPMVAGQGANVFIQQQPTTDDSCMESSGIFTDVDNRGEDDLVHRPAEVVPEVIHVVDSDMSPDVSTDTISSSNTACSQKKIEAAEPVVKLEGSRGDGELTKNTQDTNDEVINLISDGSFNSTQSIETSPQQPTNKQTANSKTNVGKTASGISHKHQSQSGGKSVKKSPANRKQLKNETNFGLLRGASGSVNSETPAGAHDHENQENKRPSVSGSAFKKSGSPNKWDAVMSKIKENKSLIKKNFSNVKSKVSCGVTTVAAAASMTMLKSSPPSESGSVVSARSVSSKKSTMSAKR
jgi:hypothetical protein